MITAILLAILVFWLTITHWVWDIVFFALALLLTLAGPIVLFFTLPVMAWCVIAFVVNINKNKEKKL